MHSLHAQRVTGAATAFDAATAAFLAFLDQLPEAIAGQPLPGGWTPAAHASHLALTNDVFHSVVRAGAACTGPVVPFEGSSDYSDGTWSMDAPPPATAPPILMPVSGIGRADAALQLRESAARLLPAIAALDPAVACYCVRLPWAVVSVYQMCEWASGHTLRHLQQVNREMQMGVMQAGDVQA
jgi:hypothetical protein